ncbi:hypothetical protein MTO96_041941 [Rhipicephalus appendiculatus]
MTRHIDRTKTLRSGHSAKGREIQEKEGPTQRNANSRDVYDDEVAGPAPYCLGLRPVPSSSLLSSSVFRVELIIHNAERAGAICLPPGVCVDTRVVCTPREGPEELQLLIDGTARTCLLLSLAHYAIVKA